VNRSVSLAFTGLADARPACGVSNIPQQTQVAEVTSSVFSEIAVAPHDERGPEAVEPVPLEVQDLECERGDRTLFSGLGFRVGRGEVLQVEGANGSGKTSLLRILCGLALPTQGVVLWRGMDIQRVRSQYFAELAYLGHVPAVKEDLTPLENLRMARVLGRARDDLSLDEALERMGLFGFEDVPARTLSAGQRRRVALARLLVRQAGLWVLDEPFTALDRKGRENVESTLADHTQRGGAAVISTHHAINLARCRVTHLHLA
jgi:heme exporter protein A